MKRLPLALIFVVWVGIVLSVFYGIQKPLFVLVARGFADTLWVITVWILLVLNSLGIGNFLISSVL